MVVNSAGYSLLGNFEELGTQDIERQFATNFWGVMYVMRAALPVMRKQRSGHIINISSVASVVGLKHCSAYGASKFALEGLSLAVAEEVEKFGIKVTVVEPGFFRTTCWPPPTSSGRAGASTITLRPRKAPRRCGPPHAGTQPGDPEKLGEVLVKLAGMATPPRMLVAGSDAIAAVGPAVEARLKAVHAFEELSKSTDGRF